MSSLVIKLELLPTKRGLVQAPLQGSWQACCIRYPL